MRKIIFIVFLISTCSFAQESVSYNEIDSASYADYMNNDLKKIKKTGKKALKENVDFYFLRMRLGIIGYNHKNYEYALPHFMVAYEMFPADTIVQEYLYFSYLFTNRTENANLLASTFSESMKNKVGYKEKRIENVSLGMGYFQNSNYDQNKNINFIGTNYNRGEANLNGNAFGQSFMVQSLRSGNFRFYNKISFFETSTLGIEQFKMPVVKQMVTYNNLQYQYNWGMSYTSKKEFHFSTGLAYFHTKTSDLDSRPMMGTMIFTEMQEIYNNFSIATTFGKRYKYVMPTLSLTYSNLYHLNQIQGEFSFTYYPLGNTRLYGTSSFALVNNDGQLNKVINQKIGFRCTDWLWLEGKMGVGNHQNYLSSNGFVSFNTLDPILRNASLDVHLYFKKMELVLGYSSQIRLGHYTQYMNPQESKTTNFYYNNNNITTTVKWNF